MKQNSLKKYSRLSEADKQEIIKSFKTQQENSVPALSKNLGVTESAVSRVIDEFLKSKRITTNDK